MGSSWEAAKAVRSERRSTDPSVQRRRREHAAQKQQLLLEKLAEAGDENAIKELKRRADLHRPHVGDSEQTG